MTDRGPDSGDEVAGPRRSTESAAQAHERDLLMIWRALGNWNGAPRSVEDVVKAVNLLRSERRQLRARLVECRPWVGVCPYPNTKGFSEMIAIRDIADDTLEEVKPSGP